MEGWRGTEEAAIEAGAEEERGVRNQLLIGS